MPRSMKIRLLLIAAATCILAVVWPDRFSNSPTILPSSAPAFSPAIYDKMVHDDPLSVGDIVSLSKARRE